MFQVRPPGDDVFDSQADNSDISDPNSSLVSPIYLDDGDSADGQPGFPVENPDYPGLRAGALKTGAGLLGMILPISNRQGGADTLTLGCPGPYDTKSMIVTGYDNSVQSTGKNPGDAGYGVTSSKQPASRGTIAAPPSYPYQTRIYVPGYGLGTVQDRGGAIQNNRLDLWFPTRQEALNWGRRSVNVQIWK